MSVVREDWTDVKILSIYIKVYIKNNNEYLFVQGILNVIYCLSQKMFILIALLNRSHNALIYSTSFVEDYYLN